MVRFLKVKHLEEQRRELVARSEIYRRTMQLESANLRFSLSLLKQRFNVVRLVGKAWKFAAPLASAFLERKSAAPDERKKNLLSSMMTGMRLARELMPLFRKREAPVSEPSSNERP